MCHICELNAEGETLPLRERVYVDRSWRVSHGWGSLPWWLVVALRRHVEALDDLDEHEAAALGSILRAATAALRQAVGCRRTYVILFAEHPRYTHLHLHVVPRMDWFTESDTATAVFRFLDVSEDEQVAVSERERLAVEIGETMRSTLA